MSRPSIAIVTPPVTKPSEPNVSGPSAAAVLRGLGVRARAFDASIGWYRHALRPEGLEPLVPAFARGDESRARSCRRHIASLSASTPALRRLETYRSRKVYSSAITHLDGALALASAPFAGVRLRISDVDFQGLPAESSAALAELAARPGPFDAYFTSELIPALRSWGADKVGISLTFQGQSAAAVRLARLLREHLPQAERILAGPLVACWRAAGTPLPPAAFGDFDRALSGGDADLERLAAELGASGPLRRDEPRSPGLAELPWDDYLAPAPVIPAALGRGCYWRRCTFCPDHLHGKHEPCGRDGLAGWLQSVSERFPDGAMLHLTDSALPPRHLARIADVVRERRLPIRWHGFVRPERVFADPRFAGRLAAGGCAMLQFGVEGASPRLLELMAKGAEVETSRAALRACRAAGILAHVYLMFGLPGETDEDRERTLAFVEEEEDAITALNVALLNLPRGSPMQARPRDFGITAVRPFSAETDLSLYDDFRCGESHPRLEARRWMDRRFLKSEAVRRIQGDLRAPFKANHACFLPHR